MKVKSESEVSQSFQLFATPWTAAHQAPPSMGFSRQEYWNAVPLPSPKPYLCSKVKNSENTLALSAHVSPQQRRQWQPTPAFLPGESQGWGSLVGCRLWGHTESDMTEQLLFHFSLSCIGEGNGNPLQCSCLENPSDGGAWWAAVYGVAQSRT